MILQRTHSRGKPGFMSECLSDFYPEHFCNVFKQVNLMDGVFDETVDLVKWVQYF